MNLLKIVCQGLEQKDSTYKFGRLTAHKGKITLESHNLYASIRVTTDNLDWLIDEGSYVLDIERIQKLNALKNLPPTLKTRGDVIDVTNDAGTVSFRPVAIDFETFFDVQRKVPAMLGVEPSALLDILKDSLAIANDDNQTLNKNIFTGIRITGQRAYATDGSSLLSEHTALAAHDHLKEDYNIPKRLAKYLIEALPGAHKAFIGTDAATIRCKIVYESGDVTEIIHLLESKSAPNYGSYMEACSLYPQFEIVTKSLAQAIDTIKLGTDEGLCKFKLQGSTLDVTSECQTSDAIASLTMSGTTKTPLTLTVRLSLLTNIIALYKRNSIEKIKIHILGEKNPFMWIINDEHRIVQMPIITRPQ